MEAFSKLTSGYGYTSEAIKTDSTQDVQSALKTNAASDTDAEKANENKLKAALAGLAVIGAGAVGIAIYMKTRKNSALDDFQKGVKKFFDNAGKSVEDVKLNGGKALTSEGSGFSGVLKTANAKGQKIELKYQNGFITESIVDGKLYKKYESPSDINKYFRDEAKKFTRNEATLISKYDENGEIVEDVCHFYDKNAKVSRSVKRESFDGTMYFMEASDFVDGRIAAKTKLSGSDYYAPEITEAKIFDKDGKVVREYQESRYCTDYYPDGGRKVRELGIIPVENVKKLRNDQETFAKEGYDIDLPALKYEDCVSGVKKVTIYSPKDEMTYCAYKNLDGKCLKYNFVRQVGNGADIREIIDIALPYYENGVLIEDLKVFKVVGGDLNGPGSFSYGFWIDSAGVAHNTAETAKERQFFYDKIKEYLKIAKEDKMSIPYELIEKKSLPKILEAQPKTGAK